MTDAKTQRVPQAQARPCSPAPRSKFFQPKTLQELAKEQGVRPVKDISVFAGGFPEDEGIDEILEEIYRLREP
jgi:hypothetical protein